MTTDVSADAELLKDVFSSSRDRGADSAASKSEPVEVEAKESEPVTAPEPDAEPTQAEDKPKGYRDPSSGRFVPLTELQSEREKRQEAQKAREEEARLRTLAEENLRRYQQQLQEMERRIAAAQNPPPPPPDLFEDPNAWQQNVRSEMEQRLANERANMSELLARNKYGDEAVEKAQQAAVAQNLGPQFMRMRDPYGALLEWHRRASFVQEIGPDPEAYKTKLRETIRNEVLEELKAPAAAKPQQHFPGSLIDATASGPQGAQPVSESAMAARLFSTERKRR